MTKVLIAAPSYEGKNYCFEQYVKSINELNKKGLDVSYLLLDNGNVPFETLPIDIPYDIIRLYGKTRKLNSREILAYCYSVIFAFAKGYNYDYLLLLETDIILPKEGLQMILGTSKMYGCLVVPMSKRAMGTHIQVYKNDLTLYKCKRKFADGKVLFAISRTPYKSDEIPALPFKIGSATFSSVLIPSSAFDVIVSEWDIKHCNHPDSFFYKKMNDSNIPIFCEPRVECLHLQKPWSKEVIW